MLTIDFRRRNEKIAKVLIWVFGSVQVLCGLLPHASVDFPVELAAFKGVLSWLKGHAWIGFLASSPALVILPWLRRQYGASAEWEKIEEIVDEFRDSVFADIDEDLHYHRVTLFKAHATRLGLRWLGTRRRLTAVARSGHLRRESISSFAVSDNGDDAEGIAGRAFNRPDSNWIFMERLDPPTKSDLESPEGKERVLYYAKKTSVSPEWVERYLLAGKTLPASLAALVVCGEHGIPWGVVVVDSRKSRLPRERINQFSRHTDSLVILFQRTR